jgi:hypothetical protein
VHCTITPVQQSSVADPGFYSGFRSSVSVVNPAPGSDLKLGQLNLRKILFVPVHEKAAARRLNIFRVFVFFYGTRMILTTLN